MNAYSPAWSVFPLFTHIEHISTEKRNTGIFSEFYVLQYNILRDTNADTPHILAVMDGLAVVACCSSKLNTFSLKTIPIRVIEFSCNATITKFVEALGWSDMRGFEQASGSLCTTLRVSGSDFVCIHFHSVLHSSSPRSSRWMAVMILGRDKVIIDE